MAPSYFTKRTPRSCTLPCRKRCLLLNNLLAVAGAVLMILSSRASSFEMIMVGRFLYGVNAGESALHKETYYTPPAPTSHTQTHLPITP